MKKMEKDNIVEVNNLTKIYKNGDLETVANSDINFNIREGELTVILGPSGAGKSTVLNIIGGMENPTEGEVIIDGEDIADYNSKELTLYRRESIGFVFQFYNLVNNLTAKENVELSTQITKDAMDPVEALKLVGLGKRLNNFPTQLSGGEQQRVSIARAIAKKPKLLLCDEPTGALDNNTGKMVLKVLANMAKKDNKTVVIITHNKAISHMADRVIEISDAKVKEIRDNESPMDVEEIEW